MNLGLKNLILTTSIVVVIAYVFNFIQINFNEQLGNVYNGMAVAFLGVILLAFMKPGSDDIYPMFKGKRDWMSAILWGLGLYIVFYLIVQFVIPQFFSTEGMSAFELIRNFAQAGFTFQAAALAQSQLLQIFSFGVLVPIMETLALIVGLIYLFYLLSKFDIYNPNLARFQVVIIAGLIIAIAVLYHVTAKGLTNDRDLTITGIFFGLSALAVVYRQQWIDVAIMHVMNNLLAVIKT